MKIILTGATGYVGEGVLIHTLEHPEVTEILVVGRKPCGKNHPKLKEIIVKDFFSLEQIESQLVGYDACFYCAGITSVGMKEDQYTHITVDTTLAFASTLVKLSPSMTFNFVSGSGTDSSEQKGAMWARVKGKAENALMKLGFKGAYNFRPAIMKPAPDQQVKMMFKILLPVLSLIFPGKTATLKQVSDAMINTVRQGYQKQILEVGDIKKCAEGTLL